MNELDRESFEKWLQESNKKAELLLMHGASPDEVTELLKLHALDGIRQSLDELNNHQDSIADDLSMIQLSLDKMAACTGDTNGYGYRLYIAGDVTAYEP